MSGHVNSRITANCLSPRATELVRARARAAGAKAASAHDRSRVRTTVQPRAIWISHSFPRAKSKPRIFPSGIQAGKFFPRAKSKPRKVSPERNPIEKRFPTKIEQFFMRQLKKKNPPPLDTYRAGPRRV